MHALAGQRVQIGRQDHRLRFAFAGLHLGDAALVQHNAAQNLHREVGRAQHAARRLAADGKRIRQDVVERFAVCEAALEFRRLGAQLVFGERLVF